MPASRLYRVLGRLCLGGSAFVIRSIVFASVVPVCQAAMDIAPALVPTEDGWVDGTNGTTKNDNNSTSRVLRASKANDSDSKQIYIRFTIPQAYIDNASTPMKAWLRLTRQTGASSGTLKVYAAKNWLANPPPTFDTKPTVATPELARITLGADVQSFDVTDCISGPGEYAFWVISTSGADVDFYSVDADTALANKPTLTIRKATSTSGDHTDFDRLIADVLRRGLTYKARYTAFNPADANHDINLVGYFDVTKHPYNARGDNITDDTIAIQRAINEARDARVAVYFPAGRKFKVTATLECVEGFIEYQNHQELGWPVSSSGKPLHTDDYFHSTDYERWNMREFPCVLMGPALSLRADNRPQLVAGASFGSGNVRPLLHFWSRGTGEGGTVPTENYPAANYNHLVRNLDIDLAHRAKAVGIHMTGAQGTAIEGLKIIATDAYAGISGLPGAGGCTSAVTILGGTYGIDAFKTALDGKTGIASVLNNCTIDATSQPDQINSIRWNHYGPLVLVGCKIVGGSLQIDGPDQNYRGETARGNLSIADSTIERLGTGIRPAVTGSRSVYMRNVYLKNVTQIADIETPNESPEEKRVNVGPSVPDSSTRYFKVLEYAEGAKLDQYSGSKKPYKNYPNDPDGILYTPGYLNGVVRPGPLSGLPDTFPLVDLPANFFANHIWPEAIDWDGADVINVKNAPYFAKGNNYDNDREAIQAAIDYAHVNGGMKVFVPAGQYLLNNTLVLKGTSVLFGLHRNYSVLKANDHPHRIENGRWVSSGSTVFDNGTGGPLIATANDTSGDDSVKMADLMLLQRMTAQNTYLLDWNAGAKSAVQNVNFNRQSINAAKFGGVVPIMNIPLIKIGVRGGGKWYSPFHLSAGNAGPDYRNMKVDGAGAASPALKFYMLDPEIDAGPTYNTEIVNRTNLDVFGSKGEGRHIPSYHLTNCRDVRWFGFAGNAYCDAKGADPASSQAVIELEDCDGIVLASSSYHPNFLNNNGDPSTDPLLFYRLKEKTGVSTYMTTPGYLGFVFFRRESNGLIVDTN